MKKTNLWMMAAILTCSLTLASCAKEDNAAGGDAQGGEELNIEEPTDFAKYIDPKVYVGDNFYSYAVGKWQDENPVIGSTNRNGTFHEQWLNMQEFLGKVTSPDSKDEVVMRLYDTYDKKGFENDQKVLKAKLAEIDAVDTKEKMWTMMAQLMNDGYQAPLSFVCAAIGRSVTADFTYPESLSEYAATGKTLEAYADMTKEDTTKVMDVMEGWKAMLLKEKIVNGRQTANSHHYTESRLQVFNLQALTRRAGSNSPLADILKALQIENADEIATDRGFTAANGFLAELTLDELKCLCKYNVVNRDYRFMAAPEGYEDNLVGGRGIADVLSALTSLSYSPISTRFSQIYNKTIPTANRDAVKKMGEEFRTVFKARVNSRKWMSEATKQKAIEKLDAMQIFVGWPDDTSKAADWTVQVPKTDKAASTTYRDICDLFKQRTAIIRSKLGQKGAEDQFYANELYASSYVANAFHAFVNNSSYILSSNLVAPMYAPTQSDAMNYAGLGATAIGHEMTHGFDSTGSKYDKDGKLVNWWSPADLQQFEVYQQQMVNYFNQWTYGPGYRCDGEQTLGENIADLGGLYIGYDVYQKHLTEKGITDAKEVSRQHREFFRGFAYAWMENNNEAGWANYQTDLHAAGCLRVNGNVYLMDAFYNDFDIKSGKSYVAPDQRIEIW